MKILALVSLLLLSGCYVGVGEGYNPGYYNPGYYHPHPYHPYYYNPGYYRHY